MIIMTRWADYDISNMAAFLDALVQWRPPVIEPEPEETHFGPPGAFVLQLDTHLRKQPRRSADSLAVVTKGKLVTKRDPLEMFRPQYTADGFLWVQVTADLLDYPTPVTGYMALHTAGLFVPAPPVEEPPVPPKDGPEEPEPEPPIEEPPAGDEDTKPGTPVPDDDELARLRMQREALQQIIDGFDRMSQGLQVLTLLISDRIEELEDVA